MASLHALNHDVLIYIFIALSIPEILLLRQVSRRLYLVSEELAVWKSACMNEILANGIPFPKCALISCSAKDLERQTLRAYKLGLNWRSSTTTLHQVVSSPSKGGAIEEIKFLRRHGRIWIVTTSLGIWWTLYIRDCDSLEVVAQWSPGKALFNGLVVNSDDQSDATIAISVHRDGYTTVEILTFSEGDARAITIQHRKTLDTSSKPIALNGDFLALCDHDSETLILNWKTQEQALLKSPDTWQDKPLHVYFARGSIFVVRARSICMFREPRIVFPDDDLDVVLPRVFKSFGWVDGVSLALGPSASFYPVSSSQPPLSLLVRNQGDDPWKPTEQFQFMVFDSESDHTPSHASNETPLAEPESISFPFNPICTLFSHRRGPLRCSDMVLGSHGTAVWVQPSDWSAVGLITDDGYLGDMPVKISPETLVVALFPGLLHQRSSEAQIKVVIENNGDGWSCLDYDEARGLIALGSGSGTITIYRL